MREEIAYGSVFMLRHFHGAPVEDRQIPQGFDAELELAMEAMQGRCNAFFDESFPAVLGALVALGSRCRGCSSAVL